MLRTEELPDNIVEISFRWLQIPKSKTWLIIHVLLSFCHCVCVSLWRHRTAWKTRTEHPDIEGIQCMYMYIYSAKKILLERGGGVDGVEMERNTSTCTCTAMLHVLERYIVNIGIYMRYILYIYTCIDKVYWRGIGTCWNGAPCTLPGERVFGYGDRIEVKIFDPDRTNHNTIYE